MRLIYQVIIWHFLHLIAVIIIFMLPYDIWNDVRLGSVFTTLLLLLTHQYSNCDPTFVRRTFENDKNKKHKQNPYGGFCWIDLHKGLKKSKKSIVLGFHSPEVSGYKNFWWKHTELLLETLPTKKREYVEIFPQLGTSPPLVWEFSSDLPVFHDF